jgi:DNA-binding NarL/FixJ family response regulator
MNRIIKIIIVDDHPLVLQGLKSTLSNFDHLLVVATASNGQQALELVDRYAPDIVLMDIRMPKLNGIQTTKQLLATKRNVKVVCITGFDDESDLLEMLRAGAKGFILKTSDTDEILRALEKVIAGDEYYCKDAITIMIKRFLKNTPYAPKVMKFEGYSDKELSVIRLIAKQRTSKEISDELFLGEKTINYYRQRIMEKMQVKTSIGMVLYALKNNMININEIF